MAPKTPLPELSPQERTAIEAFYRRLGSITHYELLGVARDADRATILEAHRRRRRQFEPSSFSGRDVGPYRAKIEAIADALDEAEAQLSDSIRRRQYDETLATGGLRRRAGTTPPPPRSDPPPLPRRPAPAAMITTRPSTPPVGPAPRAVSRRPTPVEGRSRGGTPSPSRRRRSSSAPEKTPLPQPTNLVAPPLPAPPKGPAPVTPEPPGTRAAVRPELPAPAVSQLAAMQSQLDILQSELDAVHDAVEICLDALADLDPRRTDRIHRMLQTLSRVRARHASLVAQREASAGHWSAAAAHWVAASRSNPDDMTYLIQAAESLLHAGVDLESAESMARRALALDPEFGPARALVAEIQHRINTRRGR